MGKDKIDVDEEKARSNNIQTPRELELKILKNRNGRTGDTMEYKYYAAFNYMEEIKKDKKQIDLKKTMMYFKW